MYAIMKKDLTKVPSQKKPHFLALSQKQYNNDLAHTAGIENMKEVYSNILADQIMCFRKDPIGFRDWDYKIIDDSNFEKVRF